MGSRLIQHLQLNRQVQPAACANTAHIHMLCQEMYVRVICLPTPALSGSALVFAMHVPAAAALASIIIKASQSNFPPKNYI